MRIENSNSFGAPGRYRYYQHTAKPEDTANAESSEKPEEYTYYDYGNQHQPVVLANQVIVDNPDGSRELFVTTEAIDKSQYFTKIKLT